MTNLIGAFCECWMGVTIVLRRWLLYSSLFFLFCCRQWHVYIDSAHWTCCLSVAALVVQTYHNVILDYLVTSQRIMHCPLAGWHFTPFQIVLAVHSVSWRLIWYLLVEYFLPFIYSCEMWECIIVLNISKGVERQETCYVVCSTTALYHMQGNGVKLDKKHWYDHVPKIRRNKSWRYSGLIMESTSEELTKPSQTINQTS